VIFFVPGYDPATRANLAVAERILPAHCYTMLGEGATREELLLSLDALESPLFAMSHGGADTLKAQGGGLAFGLKDVSRLGRRPVFAFACHTAGGLGQVAAESGTVWWGYTGAVSAPPDSSSPLLDRFAWIFAYIRDAFARARSTEEQRTVLLRIAELCHEAEEQIDALLEAGADLDAGSAFFCLLHIWQRLRIWEPGSIRPRMHPEAPPPILLL
jgi:hypothetical protein